MAVGHSLVYCSLHYGCGTLSGLLFSALWLWDTIWPTVLYIMAVGHYLTYCSLHCGCGTLSGLLFSTLWLCDTIRPTVLYIMAVGHYLTYCSLHNGCGTLSDPHCDPLCTRQWLWDITWRTAQVGGCFLTLPATSSRLTGTMYQDYGKLTHSVSRFWFTDILWNKILVYWHTL